MRVHIGNTFRNEHMYELPFTSHAVQPGAGISIGGQLGCSFHDGFVFSMMVLGRTMHALNTIRSDVHPGPFQFLGAVDQTLPEGTERCVLCFLVVTVSNVGGPGLAPKSSPCPVVKTFSFFFLS